MSTTSTQPITPPKKWQFWTGVILSAIPILIMIMSAGMIFAKPAQAVDGLKQFGYPAHLLLPIGVIEISCALIYAIPRTSVLGAVLVTGYLGGAIATHVRVSDPGFSIALVLGIFVWAGLFLRDTRLRTLLPLRAH